MMETAQDAVGLEGREAVRIERWILVNDYIIKVECWNDLMNI